MPHKPSKPVLASDNSRSLTDCLRSQKGAAALVTVVVVTVATLIMAVTSSSLGLGELELGFTGQQGAEAFAVADGCMEETLRRIRLDTNHGVGDGTMNLTVANGSCTIDVTASGSTRTITVKGTQGVYHAKIRTELSLSGNVITITSWSERDD